MIATRSPVARLGVQVASPLALVAAAYLFFAGHNRPGGGFAAGLVVGALVALRNITGIQRSADPLVLLAGGGLLAGAVALAPLLGGAVVLDQIVVETTLPILGKVKTGTALAFDAGVFVIVVGLVVAVLDGLGTRALGGDR